MWKFSSAGRASALQAEGHRFEPYCSHHYGLVVQLVRTLACHARGRRFDPDPGRQFASVAQSVEQGTENPRVIGSIPIGGTICGRSSSGRAPPCQGGGSEFEPRNPLHFYFRAAKNVGFADNNKIRRGNIHGVFYLPEITRSIRTYIDIPID